MPMQKDAGSMEGSYGPEDDPVCAPLGRPGSIGAVRYSRRCRCSSSQSSTSCSNHPTRFGPNRTRLGNWPAISSRAMFCGEYRTIAIRAFFDSIFNKISPKDKEHRDALVAVSPGSRSNQHWIKFPKLRISAIFR